MSEFGDIQKLVELFNPTVNDNSDDSDDEGEKPSRIPTKSVNAKATENSESSGPKKVNPYSKITTDENKRREVLDPEAEDFIYDELEHGTESDWKKSPNWDITYKQHVTASDVFLRMGFKNPTTASCEDMIIAILLPGESYQNIDLRIYKKNLTLVSPSFYLDLPLPHPVDPQKGSAKWDSAAEKLIVTLTMDRELDLVNF
nr:protein PIH1D3 [Leptinotarsa decemlineata]